MNSELTFGFGGSFGFILTPWLKWVIWLMKKFLFRFLLITSVELGTSIRGHHVYKEIWNSELGERRAGGVKQLFLQVCGLCWKRNKFVGYLKKGASGKYTETVTSKWQLRALCFLAMLQLLGLQYDLKDEERLKGPYNLNLIGQKSYWQMYENCKTRARTVQDKWIIINVFPVTFLLQWFSKMCWNYKKFELQRFELWRFFHKSLLRNFKETGNFIQISESSNYTDSNYTELTVQATWHIISFGNILLISLFLKNFHPFPNQQSNFEILQRLRKKRVPPKQYVRRSKWELINRAFESKYNGESCFCLTINCIPENPLNKQWISKFGSLFFQ